MIPKSLSAGSRSAAFIIILSMRPAIVYRYTTDRVGKTEEVFKTNKTARINSDLHPQGYLYNLIYWLSIFHQGLAGYVCVYHEDELFFYFVSGRIFDFIAAFIHVIPASGNP